MALVLIFYKGLARLVFVYTPRHELKIRKAYPHKAAAHVGVSNGEVGFRNGFFEDEVDDSFESLLCVDGQLRDLLHELLKHLRRQFVQDATHSLKQLLGLERFGVVLVAAGLLYRRLPGLLGLVQLYVVVQRHAGDDLAWLFALTLLRPSWTWGLRVNFFF